MYNYEQSDYSLRELAELLLHLHSLHVELPFSFKNSINTLINSAKNLCDSFSNGKDLNNFPSTANLSRHVEKARTVEKANQTDESNILGDKRKDRLTTQDIQQLRNKISVLIPHSRKTEKAVKSYLQKSFPLLNSLIKLSPPRNKSDSSVGVKSFAKKLTFRRHQCSNLDEESTDCSQHVDEFIGGNSTEIDSENDIVVQSESDLSEEGVVRHESLNRGDRQSDNQSSTILPSLCVPTIRSLLDLSNNSQENESFAKKRKCPEISYDEESGLTDNESGQIIGSKKASKRRRVRPASPTIHRLARIEEERQVRLQKQNEQLNLDNSENQLVLESDPITGRIIAKVEEMFMSVLMPHQVDAVQFMWNACIEKVEKARTSSIIRGCLVAHCMGLGKTLSAICFMYTLLACKELEAKTVLVVCPAGTIHNWRDEFELWLPYGSLDFPVHMFIENNDFARQMLQKWFATGGFCIMSYDMFRAVATCDEYKTYFRSPGPDMILCDEVHMLKNHETKIYRYLSCLDTKIRVGMTGTPIQNCLREYYTMIKFVKPTLLDSRKHFCANFVTPIENGQMADSTESDVLIMKRRVHVLFKILSNTVHRRGFEVLKDLLPSKVEFVLDIRLSPIQVKLYTAYLQSIASNKNILVNYKALKLIWTHPFLLKVKDNRISSEGQNDDSDTNEQVLNTGWWKEHVEGVDLSDYLHSGKIVVFLEILFTCVGRGDKVLCFSHSLLTLDYIEEILSRGVGQIPPWKRNKDYYRIDGSVSLKTRSEYIRRFNEDSSNLFLISTKAGSLGINIHRANRIVILDVSWNPSDDLQSIFRSYRIGQSKCVYVYRLIVPKCMEEVMYGRQISKLSLSSRVIDDNQIRRHFSNDELSRLYQFDPRDHQIVDKTEFDFPNDEVLAAVLCSENTRGWILSYKDHDSFLMNNIEEKLSQEECHVAWEEYHRSLKEGILGVTTIPTTVRSETTWPQFPDASDNVSVGTTSYPRGSKSNPYDTLSTCLRNKEGGRMDKRVFSPPNGRPRFVVRQVPPDLYRLFNRNFRVEGRPQFMPNPASAIRRVYPPRLSNPMDVQPFSPPNLNNIYKKHK